jgi:hypothetical protein
MDPMKNQRWPQRVASAILWTIAALTWGSIGRYLFGLPDFGVAIAVISVMVIFAPALRAINVAPARPGPAAEIR